MKLRRNVIEMEDMHNSQMNQEYYGQITFILGEESRILAFIKGFILKYGTVRYLETLKFLF